MEAVIVVHGKSRRGVVGHSDVVAKIQADEFLIEGSGRQMPVGVVDAVCVRVVKVELRDGLAKNDALVEELYKVPAYIDEAIKEREAIKEISKRYTFAENIFYLGRGFSYPIALEGALKLKEITYIHAEAYPAGELKHGPLALIDEKVPVIVVVPPGEDYDKTLTHIEEVKARGAIVLCVGAKGDEKLAENSKEVIEINPEVTDIIAPLVYTVPLQLISYYVTVEKEYNPDKPRNLAKVITV